jgi:hypothetical protein
MVSKGWPTMMRATPPDTPGRMSRMRLCTAGVCSTSVVGLWRDTGGRQGWRVCVRESKRGSRGRRACWAAMQEAGEEGTQRWCAGEHTHATPLRTAQALSHSILTGTAQAVMVQHKRVCVCVPLCARAHIPSLVLHPANSLTHEGLVLHLANGCARHGGWFCWERKGKEGGKTCKGSSSSSRAECARGGEGQYCHAPGPKLAPRARQWSL